MSLCKMCICSTTTAISEDTISIRTDKRRYSCLMPFSCWFGHTVGYALENLPITVSNWLGFCSNNEEENTSKNFFFFSHFRTSGTSVSLQLGTQSCCHGVLLKNILIKHNTNSSRLPPFTPLYSGEHTL